MPKVKLTKSAVERQPVGPKDIELWDTETPGFYCKVTPKGRRVFLAFYRTQTGTKRKVTLGQFGVLTVEQARALAKIELAKVAQGGDPAQEKKQGRRANTVKQLCERFLTEYAVVRNKPSTIKEQKRMVNKKIIPALGSKKARELTRADVAEFHNGLRKTPYEANRVLATLSKIMNEAETWGLREPGSNPCKGVTKFGEKRRERLLTSDEIRAIYAALDDMEAARTGNEGAILAIRLLFATAGRASEIIGLRWDYLRLADEGDTEAVGELVWPDNKAGGEMRKPLTSEIAGLLEGLEPVVGNPHVCVGFNKSKPVSISALSKVWKRVLVDAKVKHCGLHAIRHYSATLFANDKSIPMHVSMKMTGHKTPATYFRYLHAEKTQVGEAAEKMAKRRAEMLAKKAEIIPFPARKAGEGR